MQRWIRNIQHRYHSVSEHVVQRALLEEDIGLHTAYQLCFSSHGNIARGAHLVNQHNRIPVGRDVEHPDERCIEVCGTRAQVSSPDDV